MDADTRDGQRQNAEAALKSLLPILQDEVRQAAVLMLAAKPEAYDTLRNTLRKMEEIGKSLLRREIDEEAADTAISNYALSLWLMVGAETNREKVKDFLRGLKRFNNVKRLFIAIVRIGAAIAAPYVGVWLSALQLDQVLDSIIPSPPQP